MKFLVVILTVAFIGCVHSTSCPPRYRKICGKSQLVGEESTPLTNGFGPNVCQLRRTFTAQTFSYESGRRCSRRFWGCWSTCRRTGCTGMMLNFTKTKVGCCRGFAVDPADARAAKRGWWNRRRNVFRTSGCTVELKATVTDCLLELNLTSFISELLASAPALLGQLGNEKTNDQFTVFGVRDEGFASGPISAQGHIVDRRVEGKKLFGGLVLKTEAPDIFLHVGRAKDKSFCVNGVDIETDACKAVNGVVHIASSPLPQATNTITDTLNETSRFSDLVRLLEAANLARLLDVTGKKSRTLLAPTNDAFGKLPENTIECLLREENCRYLKLILLTHISAPAQFSCTLSQATKLRTFSRFSLRVQVENGNISVTNNKIPLEDLDIAASNGVIHAISEVIVPPKINLAAICSTSTSATASTNSPTTNSATTTSGPTTIPGPTTTSGPTGPTTINITPVQN